MEASIRSTLWLLMALLQRAAILLLVLVTLGLIGYDVAAALGHVPWLTMGLTFGDITYPQAGMAVQLGLTALLALFCVYLPANSRIMALENSHRSFHIGMRDVMQAYARAHASDREGVFTLGAEFDSIRERIAFLRQHPDLEMVQGDVLEVAAQMSHVSRELAATYSDRNVLRARDFLIARQQEIEDFNIRIAEAKAIAVEVRQWADAVEVEEAIARSQLDRLREELMELVPELVEGMEADTMEAELQKYDAGQIEAPAAERMKAEASDGSDGDDTRPETPADPYAGDDRIVALLSARATRG
ncbi:DNA repair protein [Mesobacterium pallidum]|uniref:DNA repair protein n=1 Tax=Mesobacterium pallidum TaxID=2872037 RepID=UPI001EE33966|nr:DNA repair protein [Mesobacterium pallidum]